VEKQNMDNVSDEIDLIRLLKVLVKRKWVIFAGTLAFTLFALVIAFLLPKTYQSKGFFRLSSGFDLNLEELKLVQDKIKDNLQNDLLYNLALEKSTLLDQTIEDIEMKMRNVSFPDYKKYSAQFSNSYRFNHFLELKRQIGNKEIQELKGNLTLSINQSVEPVYAYSKKDLKELTQNPKENRNFVVGVDLKVEKETPEKARILANALGEFIKDSILLGKLGDYINSQWNKANEESKKFDNLIIKDEFKLQQLSAKRSDIELLLRKYPESKSMSGRELLSLDKNGYRYLSPAAQLVGIESYIADIRENLSQNQREKELAGLKLAFFSQARDLITNDPGLFGYYFLEKLQTLPNSFFAQNKLTDNAVRQVKNELAIDLGRFMNMYNEMQFLSGPTLSTTPIKPKKSLILAVGFILGLLLSVLLAFIVDWWIINKKKVSCE
jgi:LPS O-antigen subunit length determinant protein (WzzB/FepE family)